MAASPPGRRRVSQTRALRVLRDVAEALNRSSTEQQAVSEALARIGELLGVETGWVWLRDPESGRFYSAAAQRLPPFLEEPVRMTGRSCWCLELLRSGRLTARNIDVLGCSRLAPALEAGQAALAGGLRCHASVPLYSGDRPLGVINLAMRGWRRLSPQELDLLATIADQVAVAIERARFAERAIDAARIEERARLARDLHDTLAQGLTAVALHIEAGLSHLGAHPRFDRSPARKPSRAAAPLEKALEVARASLDEARRSLRALRPAALEGRSLGEALGALARGFTADTGVRVRIEGAGALPADIPREVEEELFRIAGEALANVAKHARAREASIHLAAARGRLRLTVGDTGAGFNPRGARRRGLGLVGIEDRARLLGGKATIRSTPGRGTSVTVSVPLPRP